jgi:glycerophosphoryl diester phosphodiesterase
MSPAHLLEIKAPRIHANIEQKLAALIQEVRRTVPGADPNIVIQSFDAVFLRRYHQYDSSASLALTLSRVGQNAARDSLIVASGFVRSLIPHYADVNADLVMEARQRKMKLYVYTVNDATEMNRLLRLGVDGIITDNPPLLRAQINSMQP